MFNLLTDTLQYVIITLSHNAPVLIFALFVAAAISVYVDPEKIRQLLLKRSGVSLGASVAFGAFTPFCACGTMAVILSMMATALPWGPIMAFLTSSPLMSPDEFILYSGIISVKFAVALTVASVIVGLGSGIMTVWVEKNTTLLKNQARFSEVATKSACCNAPEVKVCCASEKNEAPVVLMESISTSCCGDAAAVLAPQQATKRTVQSILADYKIKELLKFFYNVGVKKVLVYFTIFAAIGYLINRFVPSELIMQYLGSGNQFAVPLLALIGLPLYVSGSSSVPLIGALMAGGASQGALLAFMITGPGTSAGVIAGLMTIMKKKAIALYVFYIMFFGIVLGYAYDWLLALGL